MFPGALQYIVNLYCFVFSSHSLRLLSLYVVIILPVYYGNYLSLYYYHRRRLLPFNVYKRVSIYLANFLIA